MANNDSPTNDSSNKTIRFSEVATHRTADSLWFVIEDKVYDVTEFVSEHPGGRDVLKLNAGKDATLGFKIVMHSPRAMEMLKEYQIGVYIK